MLLLRNRVSELDTLCELWGSGIFLFVLNIFINQTDTPFVVLMDNNLLLSWS